MGSRGRHSPSFLLININRLITQSGQSKVGYLHDQAVRNEAVFLGVTETWLHGGILDAEVSHDFPGTVLFVLIEQEGDREVE